MADAVAPVSLTASLTLANTGLPRCVSPAFLGFVPPTTFVPAYDQSNSLTYTGYIYVQHTIINSLLSVKTVVDQRDPLL